jgi:hypothetical protein
MREQPVKERAPKKPASVVVQEPAPEQQQSVEADGLWPIAMLRIAMELKRPGAPGLEHIIDGVVDRMGIEKSQFERYLDEHLGILRDQARENGYAP